MALDRADHEPVDVAPYALEPLGGDRAAPVPRAEPLPSSPTLETVTCPRCGTAGVVDVARRDAAGFCVQCDYPLFWAVRQTVLSGAEAGDDARRRLPGTVGAQRIASFACPHCAEPNPPRAETCLRCGRPMVVVPVPAPPLVVVAPPAVVEPPPPRRLSLGPILFVIGLIVLATVSLVVLLR